MAGICCTKSSLWRNFKACCICSCSHSGFAIDDSKQLPKGLQTPLDLQNIALVGYWWRSQLTCSDLYRVWQHLFLVLPGTMEVSTKCSMPIAGLLDQ